jgi:hypothetical protein
MVTAAHSGDLRSRVAEEILAGASQRQAAERFKVSPASAGRWAQLQPDRWRSAPAAGRQEPLTVGAACGLAAGSDQRGAGSDAGNDRAAAIDKSWTEDFGCRRSPLLQTSHHCLQKALHAAESEPARRRSGARALEGQPGEP